MNYRSAADLNRTIRRNADLVPFDVDLIAGVPRSGLLAASMLSLHLNLPLADIDGLVEGRLLPHGSTRNVPRSSQSLADVRRVIVLDDSIRTGTTLAGVRDRVEQSDFAGRVHYGAVYATEESRDLVDVAFETVPSPRVFEWNLMHHPILERACVDIDGVLCRDPSREENDDGERYIAFMRDVLPLVRPTHVIDRLVTARLEKYRPHTEAWLSSHDIRYNELVMLDLPSKEARVALGSHAEHKASVYRRTSSLIFIESDPTQAVEIARLSGRPVISTDDGRIHEPGGVAKVKTFHESVLEKHRRLGTVGFARAGISSVTRRVVGR